MRVKTFARIQGAMEAGKWSGCAAPMLVLKARGLDLRTRKDVWEKRRDWK